MYVSKSYLVPKTYIIIIKKDTYILYFCICSGLCYYNEHHVTYHNIITHIWETWIYTYLYHVYIGRVTVYWYVSVSWCVNTIPYPYRIKLYNWKQNEYLCLWVILRSVTERWVRRGNGLLQCFYGNLSCYLEPDSSDCTVILQLAWWFCIWRPPHSHWEGGPMISPWGSGSRQTLYQNRWVLGFIVLVAIQGGGIFFFFFFFFLYIAVNRKKNWTIFWTMADSRATSTLLPLPPRGRVRRYDDDVSTLAVLDAFGEGILVYRLRWNYAGVSGQACSS